MLVIPLLFITTVKADLFAGFQVNDDGTLTIKPPGQSQQYDRLPNVANNVMKTISLLINFMAGIAVLVLVGIFIYRTFFLAKDSNDVKKREKALLQLWRVCVSIAIIGGINLIIGIIFNSFYY